MAAGAQQLTTLSSCASTKVGRADLADFILEEVEKEAYTEQIPFVSY